MKILIDTNIIIGLEDAGEITERFASFLRKCAEHSVAVFVHEASKEDINRDKDKARRAATLSKIAKFQILRNVATPNPTALALQFGGLKKANDIVDAKLLYAASSNVIDFLITEDDGIHRRAKTAGIADRVFTVADALAWLSQTFEPHEVFLPAVEAVKAYSLDISDPIFAELRQDYQGFDSWFVKCRHEHRDCWIIRHDSTLAGLIIRKEEIHAEAKTRHTGPKILKLCTFKVAEHYRGQKLGEQLLKQALWYAQRNKYNLVYLTSYPKQEALIRLLEEYGFSRTIEIKTELVFEKSLGHGPVLALKGETALEAARRNYPRFIDVAPVRKFVVPIWPEYHAKLFPEFASQQSEPDARATGRPGNTIRKVYLCRAPSGQLQPGDVIFFYMTKSDGYASQSLTSVGVIENVRTSGDLDQVRRWTAKRSVFSEVELNELVNQRDPLKVIDFLLIGHLGPAISLTLMMENAIMSSWPQSITRLHEEAYTRLRPYLNLGFEF